MKTKEKEVNVKDSCDVIGVDCKARMYPHTLPDTCQILSNLSLVELLLSRLLKTHADLQANSYANQLASRSAWFKMQQLLHKRHLNLLPGYCLGSRVV